MSINLKKFVLSTCILILWQCNIYSQIFETGSEIFSKRIIARNLDDPWEIIYGPDDKLWVTESKGYRVVRVNPATGKTNVLLTLDTIKNFRRYDTISNEVDGDKPWPQGGLMGMALHPKLLKGKPYVYLAYVDQFYGANKPGNGCLENEQGCFFRTRILRYMYDSSRQQLISPAVICDSLPGSSDHNGGRLLLARMNNTLYLFYSIGDMGAGQYLNAGRQNHAQDVDVYEGKVLRLLVEPDSAGNHIPADNPFGNAVYSYGHRNPQGLTAGKLNDSIQVFSSEHGPFSDDEINLIEKGKSYGHPIIVGYAEGNYNGLSAGPTPHVYLPGKWHTTYPLVISEQNNAAAIGTADYRDPIISLYPTPGIKLAEILKGLTDTPAAKTSWVSEAPSSIELYSSTAIPGWRNSLLVPTLKTGRLLRLKLDSIGHKITAPAIAYFGNNKVRYRDLAVSSDGRKIYLITDRSMITSGPTQENPEINNERGCIIEFSWQM